MAVRFIGGFVVLYDFRRPPQHACSMEFTLVSPGFDQPGVYRITVTGHLDVAWSEILHGMAIVNGGEPDAEYTIVTGRLTDQAALMGVLNALYDRHVVVLAVETLATA